jgi:DNA polymerase V
VAGFPSPADDYVERSLDLNEFLVAHPQATFFARVRGHSMEGVGIHDGDTLGRGPGAAGQGRPGRDCAGGRRVHGQAPQAHQKGLFLVAENPTYHAIEVTPEMTFEVWGVVTFVIHPV